MAPHIGVAVGVALYVVCSHWTCPSSNLLFDSDWKAPSTDGMDCLLTQLGTRFTCTCSPSGHVIPLSLRRWKPLPFTKLNYIDTYTFFCGGSFRDVKCCLEHGRKGCLFTQSDPPHHFHPPRNFYSPLHWQTLECCINFIKDWTSSNMFMEGNWWWLNRFLSWYISNM